MPDLNWISAVVPVLVAAVSAVVVLIRLRYRQQRLCRQLDFLLTIYVLGGCDSSDLRVAAAALKTTQEPSAATAIAAASRPPRRSRSGRAGAQPGRAVPPGDADLTSA